MPNNKMIIGAVITGVAAAITALAFIQRKRRRAEEDVNGEWGHNLEESLRVHPRRHITGVFSKAKNAMRSYDSALS